MSNEIKWLKAAFSKLAYDSGLSQYELAEKIGSSQPQINRLLNPKNEFGRLELWLAVADAFGYDLMGILALGRYLIEGGKEPISPEVAGYLDKARAVLEAGGPNAEALKTIIKNMKESL